MRRDEHPTRRRNPGGKDVWVARWTDKDGKRRTGWKEHGVPGSGYVKEGPCRKPLPSGACCAQHAIYRCYELETDTPAHASTVGDYATKLWLRLHPRAGESNVAYASRLRGALAVDLEGATIGGMMFSQVERKHAILLADALLTSGRARSGVKGVLGALSAMWQDALDDGYTKSANPFMRVRIRDDDPRIRKQAREPTLLTWQQMHAIAGAAGERELMVRLMSDCGLRIGEDLALQQRDVKLGQRCDELLCKVEGPHLHVRRRAVRGKSLDGTKARSPGRVAPLTTYLASRLAETHDGGSPAVVFPTASGKIWFPENFYEDVWNPACEAVGVRATPHDLRHSWVTYVRAAMVDGADAAAAAGHTLEVQNKVYTHSLGRSFEAMRLAVGS